MTQLLVIILTQDEALHISRAIASVQPVVDRIIVVDSGSTDDTVAIAKAAGAEVLHNSWINYATQFNWALDQVTDFDGWVLRLDADEIVTDGLAQEIMRDLPTVQANAVYVGRSMHFQGAPVRHGGLFPARMIRLFRNGKGRAEMRWMDEHIAVDGHVADFAGLIIDDNRKPLDWWIAKHNNYASREVVDILNAQYQLMPSTSVAALTPNRSDRIKRWMKEHIYARLPLGLRAGIYFFYRFVIRLGFLDGPRARAFHLLQGFWYRYLVDAKLAEVRRHIAMGVEPVSALRDVLGISLPKVNR